MFSSYSCVRSATSDTYCYRNEGERTKKYIDLLAVRIPLVGALEFLVQSIEREQHTVNAQPPSELSSSTSYLWLLYFFVYRLNQL